MSPVYETIVSQLDSLSPEEIKQVKARTSFLLDHMKSDNNNADDFAKRTFYDDLAKELRERGVESVPPYVAFRRSGYGRRLDNAYEHISSFIDWHMPRLKRTEHRRALRVLAGVIAQIARMHKVPLSMVALLNCCENVHEYVDEAFPGYIESGMLPIVVGVTPRRRRHKRVRPDA